VSIKGCLMSSITLKWLCRLICSDLIARGIDLPSVTHVISYDAPVDMRKYVHRVGRTARAGREGTAWTLVEKQEVSWSHVSFRL
jgi:ATP-dependent RNA helicase DDX51/DBP6